MSDYVSLQQLLDGTELAPLSRFLEPAFLEQIRHGDYPRWRERLAALPAYTAATRDFGPELILGEAEELSDGQREALARGLRDFIPWRKGPFRVFGIPIDTEWQCQVKWQRVLPALSSLAGRRVLDVGCGNGYYGFRMLQAGAELVIGIDPHVAYVAQFQALKHFVPDLPLFVLPATLEQLPLPLPHFDTVFSMGVLYHRRSPIDHLLQLRDCLRSGGELVLETLYVAGEEGYALTPENRYARMSNVWFVPTIKTLVRWLERCRFEDIRIVDESITTLAEQRSTDWMPFDSLEQALDSDNPSLTIEGYQAPRRVIVTAQVA